MCVESSAADRAAKLDQWVELQALCIVMEGGWAVESSWAGLFETLSVGVSPDESPVIRRVRQLLVGELYDELWPTDESTFSEELAFASARSELLAIRLFERLQENHVENVDHLAGVAAKGLARLSREVPPNA